MIMAWPFGHTASAADPSLEQLEVIQELLEGNNIDKLRRYIDAHPELLEDYTYLSELLSQFMAESSNVISYLGLGATRDEDAGDDLSVVSIY